MPDLNDKHLLLLGDFYEAILDQQQFGKAASALCEHFDSASLAVMFYDARSYTPLHGNSYNIPTDVLGDYVRYYYLLDPRINYMFANRQIKLSYDYRHTSEREIGRSEYYQWLEGATEQRYYVIAQLFEEGSEGVVLTLHRTRKQGHADEKMLSEISALLPYLGKAIRLGKRLADVDRQQGPFLAVADQLRQGVVLLNFRGEAVFANRAARQILERGDGLCWQGKRVSALCPADAGALDGLITRTVRSPHRGGPAEGVLTVTHPGEEPPYTLFAAPLPRQTWVFDETQAVAALFIDEPVPPRAVVEAAAERYRLTPAERRVLSELLEGESTKAIAARLGLSPNTVRLHVEHLRDKTATHSRAELTARVLGIDPSEGA